MRASKDSIACLLLLIAFASLGCNNNQTDSVSTSLPLEDAIEGWAESVEHATLVSANSRGRVLDSEYSEYVYRLPSNAPQIEVLRVFEPKPSSLRLLNSRLSHVNERQAKSLHSYSSGDFSVDGVEYRVMEFSADVGRYVLVQRF